MDDRHFRAGETTGWRHASAHWQTNIEDRAHSPEHVRSHSPSCAKAMACTTASPSPDPPALGIGFRLPARTLKSDFRRAWWQARATIGYRNESDVLIAVHGDLEQFPHDA